MIPNIDPEKIRAALAARAKAEAPQPDMAKVNRFIENHPGTARVVPDHRTYPPAASPIAQDVALRKTLKAHGVVCSGFTCRHFLNND